MWKSPLALAALLAIGGCAGPSIDPGWSITGATEAIQEQRPEDFRVGLVALPSSALQPGIGPAVATRCHSSAAGGRVVFRPGVGARLRLAFWSITSSAAGAGMIPLAAESDLVLRQVGPQGRLTTEEKLTLNTLLATNRRNERTDGSSDPARLRAAAETIATHEVRLWNALVESLCIGFAEESGTGLLVPEADLSHLCEALPEQTPPTELSPRLHFARVFIHPQAPPNIGNPCHGTGAVGEDNSPHPDHAIRRLIGGARDQLATAASVASGSSTGLTGDFFHRQQNIRVASLGEVRMQSPRFGDPGTEEWSLADWAASGICRDPRAGTGSPRISSVHIDGASFRIVEEGQQPTHRVVRLLEASIGENSRGEQAARVFTRYRFEIERIGEGRSSLPAEDLAHLSPSDVSFTLWRVGAGRGIWSRPHCARP